MLGADYVDHLLGRLGATGQSLPLPSREVAILRTSAVDVEVAKVDGLGALAGAVFERIVASDDGARGLFSFAAASAYSELLGRDVRIEEIQPVVNELMAANLVMRRGPGLYDLTDPFVRPIWRERQALLDS